VFAQLFNYLSLKTNKNKTVEDTRKVQPGSESQYWKKVYNKHPFGLFGATGSTPWERQALTLPYLPTPLNQGNSLLTEFLLEFPPLCKHLMFF
jgi:hypothetical protein